MKFYLFKIFELIQITEEWTMERNDWQIVKELSDY